MQERCYCTYIVASRSRTLYVGVTGDLFSRVMQHRAGDSEGFTARYCCSRLVWFESYFSPDEAIAREKQLKRWGRAKKVMLIERENPTWEDLSADWGKSFLTK
jgi:putative endonuclease